MKARYLIFFAALLMAIVFPASLTGQKTQDDNEIRDRKHIHVSGFGGFEMYAGKMDDKLLLMSGGKLAILVNRSILAGIYGIGISTNHYREDLEYIVKIDTPRICFSHAGGWLGYTFFNDRPLQLGISIKAGGGKIFLTDPYKYYTPYDDRKGVDRVFVISPQLEIGWNATYWLRINLGLGYAYTGGIDKSYRIIGEDARRYYEQKSFNSPYISLGLFLGVFEKLNQQTDK